MKRLRQKKILKIEATIKDYIESNSLNGKKIAIACSAGVDSMTLLEACVNLASIEILCLHLDHSLREDSHKAKDFLEEYCSTNKIKFIAKTLAKGEITSDENSAREARYKFFLNTCQEENINDLFLAHNLNDQAETVLFRLARGTNSFGLQGIAQQRLHQGLKLHRPLLASSRQEIVSYQEEKCFSFIEDSSNQDTKYLRNLIRLKVIPELFKVNPRLLENIAGLSKIISEEQDFWAKITTQQLEALAEMPWPLEKLRNLDTIILRKVLEKSFSTNINFTNQFINAISEGGFHKINFSKNKFFVIKKKQVFLEESSDNKC